MLGKQVKKRRWNLFDRIDKFVNYVKIFAVYRPWVFWKISMFSGIWTRISVQSQQKYSVDIVDNFILCRFKKCLQHILNMRRDIALLNKIHLSHSFFKLALLSIFDLLEIPIYQCTQLKYISPIELLGKKVQSRVGVPHQLQQREEIGLQFWQVFLYPRKQPTVAISLI